jgi:lysophospholipase
MTDEQNRFDDLLFPKGAIVSRIQARDGIALRAARWSLGATAKGTVALLQGRAEFIEKYCEVVAELLERGFDVVALDWRGQGHSDRLLRNPRKGHVRHFRDYVADLEALRTQVLEPDCPRPWFALAHSMGGAVLLDQASTGSSAFERMVVIAPMVALHGLRWPRATRRLAYALRWLGLGRFFIPGGSGKSYMQRGFAGNVLTSDPDRFARTAAFVEADPNLVVGDPTIRWIDSAFQLMRRFETDAFALRIVVPTLVVAAGRDKVTDTRAIELFASRLKCGRCVTLAGAEHEVLMECRRVRERFWAAFDAFVPGLPDSTGTVPDMAEPVLTLPGLARL